MSDDENMELFVSDTEQVEEPEPEPKPKLIKNPAKKKRAVTDERKAQLVEQLRRGREKAAANRKAKKDAKPKEEVKAQPKRENKKEKEKENDYGELVDIMKGMKSELNELKEMKKAKRKAKAEEKANSLVKPIPVKAAPVRERKPTPPPPPVKKKMIAMGKFDYSQYFG